MEDLDIMRWVDLVNSRIPDGQILIHGLSMGGGIVLDLATREMRNVKALLSDAPSVTVEGIFRNVAKEVFKEKSQAIGDAAIGRYIKEFSVDPADFDRVKKHRKGSVSAVAYRRKQ